MRLKFLPLLVFALCLVALPAFAAEENKDDIPGITAWNLSCQYPYQGIFIANIVKGIDCNVATVAFPGNSMQPIHPFGDCYYIDNTTKNAFFVPLKTSGEWDSFKTHLPSGVNLRKCD